MADNKNKEKDKFLLEFNDALRAEPNADAVANRALRMLSERMGLNRCYIASYRLADDRADITYQVGDEKVPAMPDMIRLSDFPAAFQQVFDQTLVINNTAEAKDLSDSDKQNIGALGLRALVAATLRKGKNNPHWVIVAVSATPRNWTRGEIALLEEVAERTWAAVERTRAEEALRKSEERLQLSSEAANIGTFIWYSEEDKGEPDERLLQLFGLPPDSGISLRSALDKHIHPDFKKLYKKAVEKAANPNGNGRLHEEMRVVHPDGQERWIEINAQVYFENGKAVRMAGTAVDITRRKRNKLNKAFLGKMKDDLVRLASPEAVIRATGEKLKEYLGISFSFLADIDTKRDVAHIHYLWKTEEMPPIPDAIPMGDFIGEGFYYVIESGRTFVLRDTENEPLADTEKYDMLNIGSAIMVPVQKGGEWKHLLAICDSQPRDWRDDEIELFEELANFALPQLERIRADEAFRESEERLRNAVEAADYGTWDLDLTTGASNNRSFRHDQIFGYEEPQEEWNEKVALQHVIDADKELFEKAMLRARETGKIEIELRIRRPDGTIHWVQALGGTYSYNEQGEPEMMAGIVADITAHKWREKHDRFLIEFDENIQHLTDPETILATAAQRLGQELNAGEVAYADVDEDEEWAIIERDWSVGSMPSHKGRHRLENFGGPFIDELKEGETVVIDDVSEDERTSSSKALKTFTEVSIGALIDIPLIKNGKLKAVLAVHSSETRSWQQGEVAIAQAAAEHTWAAVERVRAEEKLQEVNEALEDRVEQRTKSLISYQRQLRLLAGRLNKAEEDERHRIAAELHDNLGQILAVCKMKLDFIERDGQGDKIDETSELINEAITYTRELMSSLKPPSSLKGENLKEAVAWITEKLEKHGLVVAIEDDGQAKPLDEEVRRMMLRAVRELLFNIIKHAGVHEARIYLSRKDGRVEVRVEDDGDGFDPEKQKKIESENGGFGLFNIYERIDMLGGRLKIDSEPGKGTRATVTAPVEEHAGEKAAAEEKQLEAAFRQKGDVDVIQVMLADDHEITREGLRKIINGENDLNVTCEASNGAEAVEEAYKTIPDVVIMDVDMPEMNGIKATEKIKAELPDITVIGLSFHNKKDVENAMLNAGASACLTKSDVSETLCATIRSEVRPQDSGYGKQDSGGRFQEE